ncbi:MAG: hypothetical protein H6737_21060 [Alphaproteobacteria bacterium]|nr:hypothetical protein [Alphaproteobacteria bacterium]
MVVLALVLHGTPAMAGASALFGAAGERWERTGRLPDFSWAGYRAGEPLPDVPAVASLAAPVDGADATALLQGALDGTVGGALVLGPGTFTLSDVLRIDRSGVVLRGAGPETVLDFTVSLTDLRGPQPQWSWNGGLVEVIGPGVGEVLSAAGPALRGDSRLPVASVEGLAPGQLVVLRVFDIDGSFARHLHADLADGGDCDWQPAGRPFEWPVRIASIDGDAVVLQQPLRFDVRPAWEPELAAAPFIEGVGIEHLTVRFPAVPYGGHLNEAGYNGIFVDDGAVDGWIRDVRFVNADNAVLLDRLTKHWTVEGVRLEGRQGHHGTNIASTADVLFQDWVQDADFVHGVTVDHRASGNVFRRGSGAALMHLDHHRDAPFENLFTDIAAQTDFFHGGSLCAGPPSGARTTAWGIHHPVIPPYFGTVLGNVVGEIDPVADPMEDAAGAWVEPVAGLEPPDLYQAQRDLRLGLLVPPGETADTAAAEDPPPRGACGCSAAGGAREAALLGALLASGLLATGRRERQSARREAR